jgi:hypothetical protein
MENHFLSAVYIGDSDEKDLRSKWHVLCRIHSDGKDQKSPWKEAQSFFLGWTHAVI